jgi:hypothetical protein
VSREPSAAPGLVLTSPDAIGLPVADRGDPRAPETFALVAQRWPAIEHSVADERWGEAISALETLAADMRRATGSDAPLYRDSLTLARRVLYDDIVEVGRAGGREQQARDALARCAAWDEELRSRLEELVS